MNIIAVHSFVLGSSVLDVMLAIIALCSTGDSWTDLYCMLLYRTYDVISDATSFDSDVMQKFCNQLS